MPLSDRDMMDRVFEVLVEGFANSEVPVSRTIGTVYLSEGDADWSLHLFHAATAKSEGP